MSELVTLDNLAKMLEKPVQKVYITAQAANAFRCKEYSNNLYVDLEVFQDYLDKIINEKIKNINSKVILEVSENYSKIRREEKMKNSLPKELLEEFENTCKEVRVKAKKANVDLSKILIVK